VSAAKGGAAGLVMFAAARWLLRLRRTSPVSSPDDGPPNE
jgi:hypothetical protein